jgi:pimeloyl-ACP methyl ester carboxylesterase
MFTTTQSCRQVAAPTGDRKLAVEISGDPRGFPIFLLHGTPGSRSGPKPRWSVLYRKGIQLICYDRPGYGESTRDQGRSVADSAGDVAAIADDLEIDRFAVVGRSGGGPHALACAALLQERVTRLAVLVGLAPPNAPDLDWFDGMGDENTEKYTTADNDVTTLLVELTDLAMRTQQDPDSFVSYLSPSLSASDRRVVDNIPLRHSLISTYAEAVRQGAAGWIDDLLATRRDWKIDLSSITIPTLLWHGTNDQFSPISHTTWLAKRLCNADLHLDTPSNIGHFGAFEVLPRVLSWATEPPSEVLTTAMISTERSADDREQAR